MEFLRYHACENVCHPGQGCCGGRNAEGAADVRIPIGELEALILAVEVAQMHWGGLGHAGLLRRLSGPRRGLTEALAKARHVPPDENGSGW